MKYIFKAIWHFGLKPALALTLSLVYYGMIAGVFTLAFLWNFNFKEALQAADIVWSEQEERVSESNQYWYYKTPFDAVYGRKKWAKIKREHFL